MNASEMQLITLTASCEADTDRCAAALAKELPAQTAVSLLGTLGAGKTHLVRAFVRALGGRSEDVVSPTFVLCQHYDCGNNKVHHLDAYRIQDDDEFLELGVDELFDSPAVTFVEWADRVPRCLPVECIEIRIEVVGPSARKIRMRSLDQKLMQCLHRAAEHYESEGRDPDQLAEGHFSS